MSATNMTSECRIASIAPDDAMILPHDANLRRMKFSERTGIVRKASGVGRVPFAPFGGATDMEDEGMSTQTTNVRAWIADYLRGQEFEWDFGEADAQEFIDDLRRAGFVIVPKEPTNEMLAAGCAAENIGPSGDPAAIRRSYDPVESRYELMAAKYRAIIAAVSPPPRGENSADRPAEAPCRS